MTPGPKTENPAEVSLVRSTELETEAADSQEPEPEEPSPVGVSLELELVEQQLRDRFGYSSSEQRTEAERDEGVERMLGRCRVDMDEERYVQECLREARAYVGLLKPSEKTTKEAVQARLLRVEAYARWRFRGYRRGEIASL